MVETELKIQLRRNGITQKTVSEKLRKPYSTVVSWLNGFSPLPEGMRREILRIISVQEQATQ